MGYVITQSLKKMKKEGRDAALRPTDSRFLDTGSSIDLSLLDETDPDVRNMVYYTDVLHRKFGFQTDYEYIIRTKMRSIIKTAKEKLPRRSLRRPAGLSEPPICATCENFRWIVGKYAHKQDSETRTDFQSLLASVSVLNSFQVISPRSSRISRA